MYIVQKYLTVIMRYLCKDKKYTRFMNNKALWCGMYTIQHSNLATRNCYCEPNNTHDQSKDRTLNKKKKKQSQGSILTLQTQRLIGSCYF